MFGRLYVRYTEDAHSGSNGNDGGDAADADDVVFLFLSLMKTIGEMKRETGKYTLGLTSINVALNRMVSEKSEQSKRDQELSTKIFYIISNCGDDLIYLLSVTFHLFSLYCTRTTAFNTCSHFI